MDVTLGKPSCWEAGAPPPGPSARRKDSQAALRSTLFLLVRDGLPQPSALGAPLTLAASIRPPPEGQATQEPGPAPRPVLLLGGAASRGGASACPDPAGEVPQGLE